MFDLPFWKDIKLPKSRNSISSKQLLCSLDFLSQFSWHGAPLEALDFRFYGTETAAVRKKGPVVSVFFAAGPVKNPRLGDVFLPLQKGELVRSCSIWHWYALVCS